MAFDPYWANVVFASHFDGANGSTTFTDLTGNTITPVGGAQVSTDQSMFGGACVYLEGTTSSLASTYSAGFTFGTGDFTVEAWVFISANSDVTGGLRQATVINAGFQETGNTDYWDLLLHATESTTGTQLVFDGTTDGVTWTVTSIGGVAQGGWHHIAVTRASGVSKLWLDGSEMALQTNTLTTQAVTVKAGNPLRVGYLGVSYYPVRLRGYVDEPRVTKGVARYTANFTPQTAPFDDYIVSNTIFSSTGASVLSVVAQALTGASFLIDADVTFVRSATTHLYVRTE